MKPTKEISVLIPTFRRPEMLRRAVTSCLAQSGVDPDRMEIVVVDNAPEASARDLIGALSAQAAESNLELRYVHEPRPGISHARNTAIAHSSGALVAFLDDDETAPPSWLEALRDCMAESGADAVLGPVTFEFDPAAAAADGAFLSWCYGRRWQGATGQPVDLAGMGNCMLRRNRLPTDRSPFDPELGLTGGEDLRLLMELKAAGGRVVWCAEAGVTEYCPSARTTLSYILPRKVRHGQLYVRRLCWIRPVPVGKILARMAVGAGQCVILGGLGLLLWPFARTASKKCLVKAALGSGKVAWFPIFATKAYGGSPVTR